MSDYDSIAKIYDLFTDGFDYIHYLDTIFSNINKPKGNLALDCGCGTGTLICELIRRGFSCTGVDSSTDMLSIAKEKIENTDASVTPHLVCQKLEEIDLFGAYDLCFSTLDTINHLTTKNALKSFIRRIYNFTEAFGYFIFDVKTKEFMKSSSKTQIYETENNTLILEGVFSRDYLSNYLTIFSKEGNLYSRSETAIYERFYSDNELKFYVKSAGFLLEKVISYRGRKIFICKKPEDFAGHATL